MKGSGTVKLALFGYNDMMTTTSTSKRDWIPIV